MTQEKKTKLKLRIAGIYHKLFSKRVCWADCVAWAYSDRWNIFRIDSAKGCKTESETHCTGACYCGQLYKGKHQDEADYPIEASTPPTSEMPF